MIEQVWGGGGGGGGYAGTFSELLYFWSVFLFFNSPMPFLGRFYQVLHIFWLYIMCISSKIQTVF